MVQKRCLKIVLLINFVFSVPLWANTFNYQNQPVSYWKKKLSPEVFHICREKGTEPAFSGQYDRFYEKGTYYCACCGGDFALFSSKAKFDSKTGWPSFFEPIDPNHVALVPETNLFSRLLGASTEVRCQRCGSHLGHVFDDGPKPTGKRYCMNSLALIFWPDGTPPKRTFTAEPE
jgi:peptide-methionine (R)-S-oxide reductase